MTDNHPITPPPELVAQLWRKPQIGDDFSSFANEFATFFARWGADQELEACCEWVSQWRCMVGGNRPEVGLRTARRPKPPSLKEQALALIDSNSPYLDDAAMGIIRRALEAQ